MRIQLQLIGRSLSRVPPGVEMKGSVFLTHVREQIAPTSLI